MSFSCCLLSLRHVKQSVRTYHTSHGTKFLDWRGEKPSIDASIKTTIYFSTVESCAYVSRKDYDRAMNHNHHSSTERHLILWSSQHVIVNTVQIKVGDPNITIQYRSYFTFFGYVCVYYIRIVIYPGPILNLKKKRHKRSCFTELRLSTACDWLKALNVQH